MAIEKELLLSVQRTLKLTIKTPEIVKYHFKFRFFVLLFEKIRKQTYKLNYFNLTDTNAFVFFFTHKNPILGQTRSTPTSKVPC